MLFRKRKPKSDDEVITFDELTRFPMTFYKTIGEDLYSDRDPNVIRRYLLRFYLVLGFLNFNAYVVGEIAYFIVHIMSTTTWRPLQWHRALASASWPTLSSSVSQ